MLLDKHKVPGNYKAIGRKLFNYHKAAINNNEELNDKTMAGID